MKENSREEDITKIKQRIEDVKEYIEYGLPYSEYLDLENSFDNILSDYKRVLKENEELNNRCKNLDEEAQAYVEELMGDSTLKDRIINWLNKENEELKNNTRRNENELEVSIDGDWDALKKALDEAERTNEYIIYDNGKWIKEKYCVPIQKVKDIIDRIDYDIKKTKEIISNNSNIYTSDRRNDYQIVRLRAMNTKSLDIKKRLQELLESEE